MRFIIIAFGFISLLLVGSCRNMQKALNRTLWMPEDKIVYWNEQKLMSFSDFIQQNPKVMLAFFEADCSACIIGLNAWLKFQKKHPEVTLLLVVNTKQRDKYFWALLAEYYQDQFYVIFDRQHELFRKNQFRCETAIVDSAATIIFENSIHDSGFEKKYKASL